MSGPPRRNPWPGDIQISGTTLMLGRAKKGAPLIAAKVVPFSETSPSDFAWDAQSPIVEKTHAFRDLSLGYGLKVQAQAQGDNKYHYALGVDASIGGLIVKGPLVTAFTPATTDATNGATTFFELGGALYCAMGRYILKRANDTSWTMQKDFGVGVFSTGATVYAFGGAGVTTTYAFVALNGANKAWYSTDGTTWTQFATFACIDFAAVGREFYRASDTNQLSKVDPNADPTVEANWANAASFRAGDKTSPIVKLAVDAVGSLIVLKQSGVWTIDQAGDDHPLYKFLEAGAGADDGRYFFQFGNDLHITYSGQHFRLVPTVSFGNPRLELQPIGPERITENESEVRGYITAGHANGALGAYAGLYNPDTGHSYLLKFGSWSTPTIQEGKLDEATRIDAWHGSLTQKFTSKKITAMTRSSIGAPSGHYRMYLGFSDGTVAYFVLPCMPNPTACSSYAFDNLVDGTLDLPLFHGGFESDPKSLRAFSVAGPILTTNETAKLNYKLTPSATSYTAFGTTFNTTPIQRASFATTASTTMAALQLVLHNTFSTVSPQIVAPIVHFAVRPVNILQYSGMVLAAPGLVKRNGQPLRLGASQIRSILKDAANSVGGTSMTFPDETTRVCALVDYGEALAWDERAGSWTASIKFSAVEFVANSSGAGGGTAPFLGYGTVSRLGPYLVSDLANLTVADLGSL